MTCRLTIEERPGRHVHARVRCVAADGRLYLRACASDDWPGRVWEQPLVQVARCGRAGRPVGPPMPVRARVLSDGESERARRTVGRRLWPGRDDDELYMELVPVA